MLAEKRRLRTLLRQRRRALSAQDVRKNSQRIAARLCAQAMFHQARQILLYSSDENEVETEGLWQAACRRGIDVYYPRVTADKQEVEFVRRHDNEPLIPGVFDIPVPPGEDLLTSVAQTDLVLIPGVGFDRAGHRLGRGRGYYDRVLRNLLAGALRVGLAHDYQIVSHIPIDEHDERVDYIVTEKRLIECVGTRLRKDA
ncbi:MAG: 5-formyltetrahydrofolate cyclo-ligase [Desulfurellaceae bacterium]|nr:5-formyltetrahydrofolate cyclo-ligase [Desulfurellaceae bacterium]